MIKTRCYCCKAEVDFIIYPTGEVQCPNCGTYLNDIWKQSILFAKKYDITVQETELKKKIAYRHAALAITIQGSFHVDVLDKNFIGIGMSPTITSRSKIEIYKDDKSSFAAYYLCLSDGKFNCFGCDSYATVLFLSETLPSIRKLTGDISLTVPVKEADQLVYTGATIGGISTGGFHVQEGRIAYKAITVPRGNPRWEIVSCITLPNYKSFTLTWSNGLIFSHNNSYPHRYDKYFCDYTNNPSVDPFSFHFYNVDGHESIAPHVNPSEYSSPSLNIPFALIINDLIFGALPDEEYYQKACELAEKNTRNSLIEAGNMFSLLDDYKDSKLRRGTCYHNANKRPVEKEKKSGCYVATAVYGSYDCPQVWTLRRYRDYTLAETWLGRLFIILYYAISPTLVKWFGKTLWFKSMWKPRLDKMVMRLNEKGVADTPYQDRQW